MAKKSGGLRRFYWGRWQLVLIFFTVSWLFLSLSPFALTLINSFKCDNLAEEQPLLVIPNLYKTTVCQNGTRHVPISEQVDGLTFTPTTANYSRVWREDLPKWLFNTVAFTIDVVILRLIFDSLAGYALARLRFRGRRLVYYFITGTIMVPGVVLLIPRFILLKQIGLLDTVPGYILTLAADGFGILLMKQFFESIPRDIEEAALVDGADRLRIFFQIILPLATPGLTALAILSFQITWNDFMNAIVLLGRNPNLFNLTVGLMNLRGSGHDVQYDLVLTGVIITTLPMMLIFLLFRNYFTSSVSYAGLK